LFLESIFFFLDATLGDGDPSLQIGDLVIIDPTLLLPLEFLLLVYFSGILSIAELLFSFGDLVLESLECLLAFFETRAPILESSEENLRR